MIVMFTDYQFANPAQQADFNRAEREAEQSRMWVVECETTMARAAAEDLEEKIAKNSIDGTCFAIDPSGEIIRRDFEPGGSSQAVMDLFYGNGTSFERDSRPNQLASTLSGHIGCEGRNVLVMERVA